MRALLPALKRFTFSGFSKFLEDFLARIDAPQLNVVDIRFLRHLVDFQQGISHLLRLTGGSFDDAVVLFSDGSLGIMLYQLNPCTRLSLDFIENVRGQISSMPQLSTESLSLLSSVTKLVIKPAWFSDLRDLERLDSREWLAFCTPSLLFRTWA
jgi:hypothetical protein